MTDKITERFIESAKRVGAEVLTMDTLQDAVSYIQGKAKGAALVPETSLVRRHHLRGTLVRGRC